MSVQEVYQLASLLDSSGAEEVDEPALCHLGAARWRRVRRLRSWRGHERMTVAMALSEAYHLTMSELASLKKTEKNTQPQGDRRRRGTRHTATNGTE